MNQTQKIPNQNGESLDVLIEGNQDSKVTIIMVHGFGTDKHETSGLFDDIAKVLTDNHRVIRFDFSGYGASEGKQEDSDYYKQAKDLESVIQWAQDNFSGDLNLISQSMGTFVAALLSPSGIKKTIFMGLPNNNPEYIIEFFQNRMTSKGGEVNEKGISTYPRSSGRITKVGSTFWKTLRSLNPAKEVENFSHHTNLLIIHPLQDEIVGNKYLDEYKTINTAKYIEVSGNHSFTVKQDRDQLIRIIKNFLNAN